MCHLILFMLVLGLPIFWFLPLSSALPLYTLILLISGFLFWLIARSMGKRPGTGVESLIGTEAEVVSRLNPGGHAKYLVRARGELWSARGSDVLQPGDTVNIAALDGIRLVVERRNDESHHHQLVTIEVKQIGVRANERHCH